MIPLLQTKTAYTAHTGIFASVTRPFPNFLGGAWGQGQLIIWCLKMTHFLDHFQGQIKSTLIFSDCSKVWWDVMCVSNGASQHVCEGVDKDGWAVATAHFQPCFQAPPSFHCQYTRKLGGTWKLQLILAFSSQICCYEMVQHALPLNPQFYMYLSSVVHSEASSGSEVGVLMVSVARKIDITMTHMGKGVSFNSYDLLHVLHWFLIT